MDGIRNFHASALNALRNPTTATSMRARLESQHGFTLIELLVVILIIGILAAIAIPSFLNQREKGQDACAKSMARTMETSMETYYVNNNTYSGGTVGALNAIENQVTGGSCGTTTTISAGQAGTAATCTGTDPGNAGGYCVAATSAATSGGSAHSFSINRSSAGVITRACSPVGKGACAAAGTW